MVFSGVGVWSICKKANGLCVCLVTLIDCLANLHFSFSHVDYAFAAALRGCPRLRVVLTYDVGCQYTINLVQRFIKHFPDLADRIDLVTVRVPKMHILGHKYDCMLRYSLSYTTGVGQSHGETVEHPWAENNQAGISTREMNPGARHDTLNDLHGFWNWVKVQKMCMYYDFIDTNNAL